MGVKKNPAPVRGRQPLRIILKAMFGRYLTIYFRLQSG